MLKDHKPTLAWALTFPQGQLVQNLNTTTTTTIQTFVIGLSPRENAQLGSTVREWRRNGMSVAQAMEVENEVR